MIQFKIYASYILIGFLALALFSCDYKAEPVDNIGHQLLFPNDGETLIEGNTYLIKWQDDRSTTMRIKLLKSGSICIIISDEALNTGEFQWTIPDTLEVDNGYTIKIMSNDDDFIHYESALPFKILKPSETSSFTDPRDGQVYKTVKLGERWWMAENFNFNTTGSSCFANNPSNCDIYGRLYTLSTAKNSAPPGWHLPTDWEWRTLEEYLGMAYMEIHSVGFRGRNVGYLLTAEDGVGFNAKYSGYMRSWYSIWFFALNTNTYFWTSSFVETELKYWVRQLLSSSDGIERAQMSGGNYGFSVRYIKDKE